MQPAQTWIVVADGSRARIFEAGRRDRDWRLVESLEHPEGRAHTPELVTDMPAMESGELPKEREARVFARKVAERLEGGFHARMFQRLVLVAPPEQMGYLRQALPPPVSAVVAHELTKDFSRLRQDKLEERLPEW
ncbi:MAG TPA: host attachment protein [Myxococcales bacterium]|jgi:protein required for attachment to host cells|nr:host attachment protein [Myxococcales bacterium]